MLGEILQKLTGQYRGDRPTIQSLVAGTAYQPIQGTPQPQGGPQPVSLDQLAQPKPQGGLTLESLGRGVSNVAGTVGDFLSGDNYRRDAEESAYNIGRLNRMAEDQKAAQDFAQKSMLLQQRTLGQGTQAANQAGRALNTDPSRGPLGQWQVKRNPYTGEVVVWEAPITEGENAPKSYEVPTPDGRTAVYWWNDGKLDFKGYKNPGGDPAEDWNKVMVQAKPDQNNLTNRRYAGDIDEALKVFQEVATKGYDPTQAESGLLAKWAREGIAGGWSKRIAGDPATRFAQAARQIITAKLRKESGAAISADEFTNAYAEVIPTYGDDPATVQQKIEAINRELNTALDGTGFQTPGEDRRLKFWKDTYKRQSKPGVPFGKAPAKPVGKLTPVP